MITFYAHHLEELKNCVLIAAGIKNLTPGDCKLISALVTNKTRQTISETTLKRVFGFAYSKFKPSYFTIDVLAKYCGYEGWENFCENISKLKTQTGEEAGVNWQSLQKNASKITGFTLQALKNKSGIPYNLTIKREFIDDHLNEFINSDYTGTIISAPSGYGKTTAICHWIDEKLATQAVTNDNDVVLFFSSDALMSVLISGRDVNSWMLALLGYSSENDINAILDETQRKNGKFYLIIDGLNGHLFKNEHLYLIFKQVIDLFSLYQDHSWFKIILVTRTATWINHKHEMETHDHKWHSGSTDPSNFINVPLFNLSELKQLSRKINPLAAGDISIYAAEYLNNPILLQYYYKLHKSNFRLDNINRIDIYEVISEYAYNTLYLGQHSSEKLLLINHIIAEFDVQNNVLTANKLKVNDLIKQYAHAYYDLLGIGLLKELNESNAYKHSVNIMFVHFCVLEHSMASVFLYNNNNNFDQDFIRSINNAFANTIYKLKILKWGIFHAIKNQQIHNLEYLTEANLNANEKLELLAFLGEMLEKEFANSNTELFKHAIDDKLFDYCQGIEFIGNDYKKLLNALLNFTHPNKKQILLHVNLAITAIAQLNIGEVETQLDILKAYPKSEYEAFIINPLHCIDAIYYHLKYGIIKKEVLISLTKLQFSLTNKLHHMKPGVVNDLIVLIGLFTLLLCNNPKKSLRFINVLNNNYRNLKSKSDTSTYNFLIKILESYAYFQLGDTDKGSAIYYSISDTYKKRLNMLTPYMKITFHDMKALMLITTAKFHDLTEEIRNIDELADSERYRLHKLYVSSLVLKTTFIHEIHPVLHKHANYQFNKIIREEGLSNTMFPNQI